MAKPVRTRAASGGEIAVNGYLYKGGQFLPSTTAEPGRWRIGKRWVTAGKEQVEPGVWQVQPTPFSRAILRLIGAWGVLEAGVMKLHPGASGQGVRDSTSGEPITRETLIRPGVKGVLGKEDISLGALMDAYNAGLR